MKKSSSAKRVLRRQMVSWVVEESQHRLCSRVTIGSFPDDVLLEIFDFYLDIHYRQHDDEDAWHALVHACRRWRSIIFASPHRLRLRLLCTNKRPMQNTFDLWPAWPIAIRSCRGMSQPQDANNIIAAFQQHSRICSIHIYGIPNMLLNNIRTMEMKGPFPVLTSLALFHGSNDSNASPLPDSFLGGSAPRLRTLSLDGIPFPALPKLLVSAHDLVELNLWRTPLSGYFSPGAMVTVLSTSTNLRDLRLEFRFPRPRADQEKRLLPCRTRVVLPALTLLQFKGDSEYMQDIVGRIDTPLLDHLRITFFNQLIFDMLLLHDFISRTEAFKSPHRADIDIRSSDIRVTLSQQDGNKYRRTLSLAILCRPLDWQLSSFAQVFNSALSHFFTFEHLKITGFQGLEKHNTENVQWLEALHPFTSVKNLVLGTNLIPIVAPALEDLVGETVIEVLPALQNLFIESRQPSEPVKKAIGKFISARRLESRPITVQLREREDQDYVLWEVGDR